MPAMDVMLVVIVMVVVLVLAILYAMQIKSSGEEQTFKLGSRMDIVGPGSTEKSVDCSGDECHYTITANDIRFELESGKEQSFDMVAIADYADSGRNRHLIYAGYDTSITYGPIIPISSSDLTTPCSSNYVYKLHDCAGGHPGGDRRRHRRRARRGGGRGAAAIGRIVLRRRLGAHPRPQPRVRMAPAR